MPDNVLRNFNKIASGMRCVQCGVIGALEPASTLVSCSACKATYPITNGVISFVEASDDSLCNVTDIENKTNTYFGFEWDYFSKWGFIDDASIEDFRKEEYHGGLVSHRTGAFDRKCRMDSNDLREGNIVLDAGCGNGRYTYEAALRGQALVVGVDIGGGSTQAARKNTAALPNALIIRAALFDLPFADKTFNAAFSNGVLMHTGDARKAFAEVARTVAEQGTLVVNVYHKLNPIWESIDYSMRCVTTRLSINKNLAFARKMAKLGKWLAKKPKRLEMANKFMRIQTTEHHMFDWYSAPIATHHTYPEIALWFKQNDFIISDSYPEKFPLFNRPWAVNLKGIKNL
jgi:SAM-dependent methyltransferase